MYDDYVHLLANVWAWFPLVLLTVVPFITTAVVSGYCIAYKVSLYTITDGVGSSVFSSSVCPRSSKFLGLEFELMFSLYDIVYVI